jgi:uncharacterized membrane protein YcaP (DUF421 family)
MEEYMTIVARTLFLYFLILIIFRLMGKREIGELSHLDLVVFIMIGEMAVVSIENTEDPLLYSVFPMIILMLLQISLAYISLKNKRVRDLLDGKPSVIISNGQIDEEAMRKQRYNFDDLLMHLRDKNIKNVSDVEFAILETSGKLSVFEKKDQQEKQKETSNSYGSIYPLILDGEVQEQNLAMLNKTNFWLRQQLRNFGYKDLKKISFCSYENGTFFIDLKDDKC